MSNSKFRRALLHPRHWLSWLGMGIWALFSIVLPYKTSLKAGKLLGSILYKIAKSRAHIARVNIKHCYPELDEAEREKLVLATIQETAIAVFESGASWFWPERKWSQVGVDYIGFEHLEKMQEQGKGVLLLTMHFTPFEICGALTSRKQLISAFYRPHNNAVYEYLQARGRIRHAPGASVIPSDDVRGIIKSLRQGKFIAYLPDQDYGRDRSVFAPYFGIQTATVKAPNQLITLGKAELMAWITTRDPNTGRYRIEITAPMTDQLGNGDIEDATVLNAFIEEQIRKWPEQYLWVHRRFKTRPEGEASFY